MRMRYRGELKTEAKGGEANAQSGSNFFAEFCGTSSIHGVRYFTERRRHWLERAFWSSAILFSLYMCGTSVGHIWLNWQSNPSSISLTEQKLSISDIPFPTVTICSEIKAHKDKVDLSSADLGLAASGEHPNMSAVRYERSKAMSFICSYFIYSGTDKDNFLNNSIYDVFVDIAPTSRETFPTCLWNNYIYQCSKMAVPTLTDEGLCFALNALNSHQMYTNEIAPELMIRERNPNQTHQPNITNWSLENGYTNENGEDAYPMRLFKTGKNTGLTVWLAVRNLDFQSECTGTDEGFKITLSMPGEAGQMSKHVYHLPLAESATISIKSQIITTSEGLRSYKPNQRQCFYSSERRLRFFRMYTQNNCEIECLSNFTKLECGCVKFSMPRDSRTLICGWHKVSCYETAQEKFLQILLSDNFTRKFRSECNCLPACTAIKYHGDIDRMKYKWKAFFYDDGTTTYSKLTIVFRDHQVETLKRTESVTLTDFLATTGGLMGLFLGVSVLSVIEFIYYFTLRLYCNHRSRSQHIVAPIPQRENHQRCKCEMQSQNQQKIDRDNNVLFISNLTDD